MTMVLHVTQRVLTCAAVISTLAQSSWGQVAGTVIDQGKQPVAEAIVELWSPTARLAVTRTDRVGRFRFVAAPSEEPLHVIVRTVGFAPRRIAVVPGDTLLSVELWPVTVAVEPLTVAAPARLCPAREEAEARALWEAVRRRYVPPTAQSWWAEAVVGRGLSPASEVGLVDRLQQGKGRVGARESWFQRSQTEIARSGYAVRNKGRETDRDGPWVYARLESTLAGHFATTEFSEFHTFSALATGRNATELRFCSKRQGRPELEGLITVTADTTLLQIEWRFLTVDPSEIAGGEIVVLAPKDPVGPSPLLPASGFYWRKVAGGFYQERWDFVEWHQGSENQ